MSRIPSALACASILAALVGCEAPANALDPGQSLLGKGRVVSDAGAGPVINTGPTPVPNTGAVVGDACRSDDLSRICLGVKYVVYRDSTGLPVVSRESAVANVRAINQVWRQCGIAFQIDQYLAVKPDDSDLRYRTANYPELEDIRNAFGDDSSLLVVTTGTWDRAGSLGGTGANAWTSMPGGGPYGAVLERPVGTFANIIGHELGHYLNLQHVSDASDIMNPIIYSTSTRLTPVQCRTARSAASFFWSRMYR